MKRSTIFLSALALTGLVGLGYHRYVRIRQHLYDASLLQAAPVHTGDLLFSEGHSLKSDLVRIAAAKYRSNYSHVGFLRRTGDRVHVVHMSIDDGCILDETPAEFIRRNRVLNIGVYRIENGTDTVRLCRVLDSLLAIRKPFDYGFDMNEDETYYCTELICKVLKKTGTDIFDGMTYDKILYPPTLLEGPLSEVIIHPNQ